MYRYETHLHTSPVSKCAKADPRECMEYYKELGYDGIFITNHFLDGHINVDPSLTYEEKINFYFSDFEKAKAMEEEIGIKVFCGVEMTHKGNDFLIYGLDKAWYLAHPQIMDMNRREELEYLMENGALVIHAHPFREAGYIDCIRLYPRSVHGTEVINACRTAEENQMAMDYANHYGHIKFAGSDNHIGRQKETLAGMCSQRPIESEIDFVNAVKNGEMEVFELVR